MTLILVTRIIFYILQVYNFILFISIIISWIPSLKEYKIFRIIDNISDWYFDFFENLFKGRLTIGPLNLSYLVALFVFEYVSSTFYISWI